MLRSVGAGGPGLADVAAGYSERRWWCHEGWRWLKRGQVRDPTTWTVLQNDGPSHLGLWQKVLPEHQMALITSGCVPFRLAR